ncbi:hypothetical protein, partial [Enterobacter hormaechei]
INPNILYLAFCGGVVYFKIKMFLTALLKTNPGGPGLFCLLFFSTCYSLGVLFVVFRSGTVGVLLG